jgi:hypothetical protein
MLVVTGGMMRVVWGCRVALTAIERRQRVEGRMGHVFCEVAGQPSIKGDGEHAEPDAEPISPEPPHDQPTG